MKWGHKIFLLVKEALKIGGAECLQPPRHGGGSKVVLNGGLADTTEGRDRRPLNGVSLFPK